MRRREFITLLGGAAAWPSAARAQQFERIRRVGVLTNLASDDPEAQARLGAFLQGLQEFGWAIGRNVRIDYRWGAGSSDQTRRYAAELVALAPDVILTSGATAVAPLLQATRSVPIVFAQVPDPVGAGFVKSLAHPGGNATGFLTFEYGLSAKWLELLREIAPGVTRAAVIRDPAASAGIGQWGAIQAMAPSVRVLVSPVNVSDANEMERDVAAFARGSDSGLIVTSSPSAALHRDLIVTLAARHRLPAVYYQRVFVTGGGLISYGPDFIDQYRRAASYVDRILKGEKPADLPVQAPTKYELAIKLARPGGNVTGLSNLGSDLAAKRLGLLREVFPSLRRLAIMANADYSGGVTERDEIDAAARTLGLEVVPLPIRRGEDIASAFDGLKGRAEALYTTGDPLVNTHRLRINTFALAARLPTMFPHREYVEGGGLMSYGPNFPDLNRRAADYVDKILRGAKPADLPVEQPTKFDLVVNLTTAKALGIEVPAALLVRADEVIE